MTIELLKHGVLIFIVLCVQHQNCLNNYEIIGQIMKRTRRQKQGKKKTRLHLLYRSASVSKFTVTSLLSGLNF